MKINEARILNHHDDDDYDGDEEEALSLSDLLLGKHEGDGIMISEEVGNAHELVDEFQFFGSWAGEMCAAEDVFYQGRILPLRPSVSSDPGLRSMGRFDSSRSSSINSSSSSGRRSDSVLLQYPLYAHPSPKPQMGRRSFGGVQGASGGRRNGGWGLLRLGLVQSPPSVIELQDLKQRSFRKSNLYNGVESIKQKPPSSTLDSNDQKHTAKKKEDSRGSWLSGFSCKCSASTAVDTVLPSLIMNKRRGSESPAQKLLEEDREEDEAVALVGGRRRRRVADRRTYEWLQKLSIQGGGGPQT